MPGVAPGIVCGLTSTASGCPAAAWLWVSRPGSRTSASHTGGTTGVLPASGCVVKVQDPWVEDGSGVWFGSRSNLPSTRITDGRPVGTQTGRAPTEIGTPSRETCSEFWVTPITGVDASNRPSPSPNGEVCTKLIWSVVRVTATVGSNGAVSHCLLDRSPAGWAVALSSHSWSTGGHHEQRARARGQVVHRLAPRIGAVTRDVDADAHFGHLGALARRPLDAGDRVGDVAGAVVPDHLSVEQFRAERHTLALIAGLHTGSGDDAGDVRAVADMIAGVRAAGESPARRR